MWRLVLTVSLLCWSSEGKVSCKNGKNKEVDWFIIYKAPKGFKSLYIDSDSKTQRTFNITDDLRNVLANTLQQLFTPIRKMPANFGFISYSDQPPGSQATCSFGHSKGVVLMEKDSTGVWLLHSTPQFPFRRDQNKFYPNSGEKNAQTFLCVTFQYDQFGLIGKHLQAIRAFPFEHDLPEDFHQELKAAVNWEPLSPPRETTSPPRAPDFQELTSRGGQKFFSIAKDLAPAETKTRKRNRDGDKVDSQSGAGDLYVSIAHHSNVLSDLNVQTWGQQKDRSASYFSGQYKVFNIKRIATNTTLGSWTPSNDHSKWCVTTDQNRPWTCIADVNRAMSQYKRPGGALCINDVNIRNEFQKLVGEIELKSDQEKMDVGGGGEETEPMCDTDRD